MESLPQEHSARESVGVDPSRHDCVAEALSIRPHDAANDLRMAQLARTIEQEIIPRLMLAHRTPSEPPRALASNYVISSDDVEQFARLVLSHDEDIAFATIQKLRARDIPVDRIYIDLLGPTARYLGELWEDDLCNFTDVTVGLGRLQRVLRELSPALGSTVDHPAEGRRVLLMPSPGEQHTFGLVMVAEFFRQTGWDVTGGAWAAGADAAAMVAGEWFDVIGFSLGSEIHLPALTATIVAVRQITCNRALTVLVGGPLFGQYPDLVGQVGADGMTIDGREAPSLAETLINQTMAKHGSPG